jgi:hypothetical protein
MNVGIGTEATLFPEKEYIMDISFAVQQGLIGCNLLSPAAADI